MLALLWVIKYYARYDVQHSEGFHPPQKKSSSLALPQRWINKKYVGGRARHNFLALTAFNRFCPPTDVFITRQYYDYKCSTVCPILLRWCCSWDIGINDAPQPSLQLFHIQDKSTYVLNHCGRYRTLAQSVMIATLSSLIMFPFSVFCHTSVSFRQQKTLRLGKDGLRWNRPFHNVNHVLETPSALRMWFQSFAWVMVWHYSRGSSNSISNIKTNSLVRRGHKNNSVRGK